MALVLSRSEVSRLVTMEKAIEVMEDVFRQQAEGRIVGYPSFGLLAGKRDFRFHAGALLGSKAIGVRMFPAGLQWPASARERQIAVLYDTESAELLCVAASPFGSLRIGAVMGLAAKVLSPPKSSSVGMLGAGGNTPNILQAILLTRPSIKTVSIYSRNRERRERFANEMASLLGLEVRAAESAEEAVREKDIILASTDSAVPVLNAEWIPPNSYFASSGMTTEVGPDIIEKAKSIVLSSTEQIRSSPARQQDALLQLIHEGRLSWGDVNELGNVVCGKRQTKNPLSPASGGITVFLQASGGFPELALNFWAFRQARELGLGRQIDLWE